MSARIETSTSVKQWATPLEKHVTGQPPGPEDRPSTIEGEARRGNVRTITPSYKYGSDKPGAEINLGQSGSLPRAYGDYTVEQRQDMYKQTFIDPKVRSNANMPALSSTVPEPRRPRADDFPSQHTKRSFVKVDPLEQRKLKSVETIPITTSSYLTQSIERHRDMEASKLRDYLKAKEGDANKPWDKPGWPGPKPPANDESLRELESIKKSIETLQKAAQEPKKQQESGAIRREFNEAYARKVERYNSLPQLIQPSAVIHVKDDKPRSIMKRRELENREQMLYPAHQQEKSYTRTVSNVHKPVKTETVQRFEETRRTEEIERRVQRKERKDRRSRHHSSSRREEWGHGAGGGGGGQWRSSSLSRHQNGYLPSNESYFKQTSTRRDRDQSANRGAWEEERNLANARYGSLSDSLRRGELKYIPNGEVREAYYKDGRGGQKVHKSYSTRDVFDSGMDRHSAASYGAGGRRSSQGQGVQPLVEFPPSLPRRGQHEMDFRPVSKSRSFADWDDQSRAGFKGGHQDWAMQRRYDDDMTRLEAEFRDSLLMPIPNGNMHERDQRTEQLPGGYETYYKDNRANAGRRLNRDGQPVDFSDASHEYSYKREQETSDRRR